MEQYTLGSNKMDSLRIFHGVFSKIEASVSRSLVCFTIVLVHVSGTGCVRIMEITRLSYDLFYCDFKNGRKLV
jgi:hypothetical protein